MLCTTVICQQIFLHQDHQLHFLWTRGFSVQNYRQIVPFTEQTMKIYGFESATLSFIEMIKYDCVTKEKYDIMHGISSDENEAKEKEKRKKLRSETVGDDLEKFIKKIKNGELTKATITEYGEESELVHLLCLLNKEERRKMETNEKDYTKTFWANWGHEKWPFGNLADVPKHEKTEYKHLKYSKSLASRKTYVIGPGIENIFLYMRSERMKSLIDLEKFPSNEHCQKSLYIEMNK